jgi:hypothetical protein
MIFLQSLLPSLEPLAIFIHPFSSKPETGFPFFAAHAGLL